MIWWDQEEWKAKAWGCPHGTSQHISRRLKHLSLGMPKASPSSSTKYQVISSETIFLFSHILSDLLGAHVCFYSFFVIFWINWILAFLCGRETRSAFSCEYSSLISVEYSCLATAMLSALVFHASLVRAVSSFVLESTLVFHCWTCTLESFMFK